jgi:aspartyl-tRNA(Asn)/glutamyl-tRNA(Gln) amidotransferase subunit C
VARLTLEQVQHVARLAALSISDDEAVRMCEQLGSILDHMATLDALDVADVEPTFHPLQLSVALRPDVVIASPAREVLLAAAPESELGAFAVPKVLDGDG